MQLILSTLSLTLQNTGLVAVNAELALQRELYKKLGVKKGKKLKGPDDGLDDLLNGAGILKVFA